MLPAIGSLSGLPLSTNAGLNSFVVSATDLGGLTATANLFINVTAVPIIATITKQSGNLLLGWTGGLPPYQVQTATNLINPTWQNLGSPTTATNLTISSSNTSVYYRIQGQ